MGGDDKTAQAKAYLALFGGDLKQAISTLWDVANKLPQDDQSLAVQGASAVEAPQSAQPAEPPAPRFAVSPDAPVVIEVAGVSKTYKLGRQRVEALKDVSLRIQQGEFIAITGTSGSGKSTLLQLIGGLDKPTGGTVSVDGQDIGRLSDRRLSVFRNRTIGFVFQFFYLQPFLRLQTNLEVPGMFARTKARDRAARATELAQAVGLSERLRHLPKELSGGQMQRAAIARALLNRPKVLLADEPTGNLDSENSHAIIELFEKIRSDFGTTVVIVTHDAAIAARADREITMKDGAIVS